MIQDWNGRKVCFLGDSITEYVGVTTDTVYWARLREMTGIIPFCYGKNGAKFRDLLSQVESMKMDRGNDFDAVFIFAGTNDFNGSTPIGEWYTEKEELVVASVDNGTDITENRIHRTFDLDHSTLKGSINVVLSTLKADYPDKQIVIMTPVHRAFARFGDNNIQYDEMYSNSIGHFADEYVEVVREAASIWATELIDLHSASGLFPLYGKGAEKYFCNSKTDRLHPNAAGHERLAKVIAAKMNCIPVF